MEESKNPGGRPTLYKEEYCEKLVEHMAKGLSFETFAATIDCSRAVLYLWEKEHPKFIDAKKRGMEKSQHWWETEGIAGMWSGKIFNQAVWYMNMKNRFGWRDKMEVSTDKEKPLEITMNYERKKKKPSAE